MKETPIEPSPEAVSKEPDRVSTEVEPLKHDEKQDNPNL